MVYYFKQSSCCSHFLVALYTSPDLKQNRKCMMSELRIITDKKEQYIFVFAVILFNKFVPVSSFECECYKDWHKFPVLIRNVKQFFLTNFEYIRAYNFVLVLNEC